MTGREFRDEKVKILMMTGRDFDDGRSRFLTRFHVQLKNTT